MSRFVYNNYIYTIPYFYMCSLFKFEWKWCGVPFRNVQVCGNGEIENPGHRKCVQIYETQVKNNKPILSYILSQLTKQPQDTDSFM